MKFEEINNLNSEKFRRLVGIKRTTFDKMLIILKETEVKKKYYGGAPNKLSLEDRILMTLEYWRDEYRTYFHIGLTYGISEANCYRNIRWIEDTLIKHPEFQLLGEKELLKDNFKDKTIIIDATESSIQRPKKNKKILNNRYITTKELKELFGLALEHYVQNGKFNRANFERRTINLALEEISLKTNLIVLYVKNKEGNNVVNYNFSWRFKTKEELEKQR